MSAASTNERITRRPGHADALADDHEDAGADDGADAERGQVERADRALELPFALAGMARLGDEVPGVLDGPRAGDLREASAITLPFDDSGSR